MLCHVSLIGSHGLNFSQALVGFMQPALLDHDYAQIVLPLDMTRVDGHNLLVAGLSSLQVFDMVGVDVTQEDEAPFTWSGK